MHSVNGNAESTNATSASSRAQLLAQHCSTHLSLCIQHLLVAHHLSRTWQPTVLRLTQQAVGAVRPDRLRGDMMDIRYYVHIQPIPGGRKEDSSYVDGLAFQHTLPNPSTMVRYTIDSPRVLLVAGAIEPPPSNRSTESRLLSSLLDSAQRDVERVWLDKRLPSVLFLRPDIIFVERHVSRYVAEALKAAGVSVATGVERGMLERIARCTRATVLNELDDVDGRSLGTSCGRLRVEEYGIVIDESERQDDDDDDDDRRRTARQQQETKKQEVEIELSDLFGGVSVKRPPTNTASATSASTSARPSSSSSFDPFGGLLGSSPPPPATSLTSMSPANGASILASSFYNVGGSGLSGSGSTAAGVQQQGGSAGSFADLFSGLSVRDNNQSGSSWSSSSPFSPTSSSTSSMSAASSRLPEPTYVPFFFLRGCPPSAHCTLVLRGSRSLATLHKLQRVVQLAVHIAYNLSLEQVLLFEMGVTYTAQSLAAMEQKALQNIEQARLAMQAVEEGGGSPQYMTLISSSSHITLPPIPFYPSLLSYRAHFPLLLPIHLQAAQPAAGTTSSFRPNSATSTSSQPVTAIQPSAASTSSQPVIRDLLNFSAPTPTANRAPAQSQPPFDPSQLDFLALPPPTCTALMQSNLLVGSCWFTSSGGQCREPNLETIDFYSSTDNTLDDFLSTNCFNAQRCVNPTCKKDIFRHKLAYTHNDGRLLVTVKQRRPEGVANGGGEGLSGLPMPGPPSRSTSSPLTVAAPSELQRTMSPYQQPAANGHASPPPSLQHSPTSTYRGLPLPAPPVLQSHTKQQQQQSQQPRGAATVTHASTPAHPFSFSSQAGHPPPSNTNQQQQQQLNESLSSLSHPPTSVASASPTFSSDTLITWSGCKLCGHRVTSDTPLSAATLSYSFGKFLDLTFNQHVALSTCSTCPHPVHTSHVRYIAKGNSVACFEYELAVPFAVIPRERVKYDRSEVMEGRLRHLSTLAMVSNQVFDAVLSKIGEIEANSRSAAYADLLQELHDEVKHEEAQFTSAYKRNGLNVSMLESIATMDMSAERNSAALVQSLVEGSVDDEAVALFGDEKSPTGDEGRREQRPLLDTFDVHRLHRKLVMSLIEWNKTLPKMCSFIFPKGWEDSADATGGNSGARAAMTGTGTATGSASGAGTGGADERKERSSADILQISIEHSAHRVPPASASVAPSSRDSAVSPSPSPYSQPATLSPLPASGSREPLTPTLFSSLHATPTASAATVPPAAAAAAMASSVSPTGPRSRHDSNPSAPLLDTLQSRSMQVLSNMSDMFGGSKKAIRRSFRPNVTVDDLIERSPNLKDVVSELIASPLNHGHFLLPPCVGGMTVPVYDDEPSSVIAYTLASFEHLQLVNPSKADEMKQLEKDRAAAETDKQQQQQASGAAVHANGRAAAPRSAASGELNLFDDAVHVSSTGDGGLLFIDNYISSTAAASSGTADLFDLSSFGAAPPAATASLHRPPSFSFAAAAAAASPQAFAAQHQQSSSQQASAPSVDSRRAALLGAAGPRSSISAQLYAHPHAQWYASERTESGVWQCMLAGFADKDRDEQTLRHRFEDVPHHPQQAGEQLTQFKCVAYFPRQFHALRSHTCSGDYDFIQSLSRCEKHAATGGKSGSEFSKTSDGRYLLKSVKRVELDMFVEIAPHYFAHMADVCFRQTPSALVKTLGLYTVSMQRGKKEVMAPVHILVMPNLFYGKHSVKVFDLKGSERNRYIKQQPQKSSAPQATLPPLPPSSSSALSVLSAPTSASPSPPTPPAAPAESSRTLLDMNLWEFTRGLPIPVREDSYAMLQRCLHNDSFFLAKQEVIDYSLLVGLDQTDGELLVGVIDYNRKYDLAKRLETGVKSMGRLAGQAKPTIVNPAEYRQRFLGAMRRYFMIAPDQCSWFRKVQDREDVNIQIYTIRDELEEKEQNSKKGRGNSSSTNNERQADRGGSGPQSEKPSGSKMGMFKWGKE